MGNRAVITTKQKELGIYLHWNGGRDSVEGFLTYCKLRGFRTPETDNYGWARLTQVIANFIGGDLSIGIDRYDRLDTDNYDNGVYIIENWRIVGREFMRAPEQRNCPLPDMLMAINEKQPVPMSKEELKVALAEFIEKEGIPGLSGEEEYLALQTIKAEYNDWLDKDMEVRTKFEEMGGEYHDL